MAEPRHRSGAGFGGRRRAIAGVVIVVAIALWVVFSPSPYSKVTNLESRGRSVIAFGDSLTAGYRVGDGEDYPSRLSELTSMAIVNAGVSGDTTAAALARLEGDVLSQNPRIVIVGLGGNDFLRGVPINTTEANLRTIVKEIQGEGAMVVLLGFAFPSLQVDYETMYENVAKEEGCLLVPRVLRGILSKPSLKVDTVHPNAEGYRKMAARIEGPFSKLLKKANATR